MRAIYFFLILFLVQSIYGQSFDSETLWEKGIEAILQGDYLRGYEYMNEFIQLNSDNAQAYNNRAVCLNRLGDQEGSCADFNQAASLGSDKNSYFQRFSCKKDGWIKRLKKYYYRDTEIYPELGYRPRYGHADSLRGALRSQRTCFNVYFYNLTVRIIPGSKSIEGKNEIWFHGIYESKEIQIDLFENYSIDRIIMNDQKLSFRRDGNAIFITLPESIIPGSDYMLQIEYSGRPEIARNPPWLGGFVWERDKRLNRWVSVACEYLGASSWWPVKDHLSDRPDSMGIHIEVPGKYAAVSNGRLRSVEQAGNGYLRFNWFVSYPINNYNVTFYMGKYDSFYDTLLLDEDTLLALYYVMPYHKKKAEQHFKQARNVVACYNEAFGPFPFWNDHFRMVEASYEGMEHQTAIAYGNSYDNAKNSLTYLNRNYDYIIVHEAAHEWWGNSVAAADMADIWIHEGFATYSEILFLEKMDGYEAAVNELHNRMNYILNIYPLIQNRDVNENTFVGGDVYTKGAVLLHCIRATLNNDTLFKSMLHDFNLAYRDSTIDSDVFIDYVHQFTGSDFKALFDKFLFDTDLPVLNYTYQRKEGGVLLSFNWTGVEEGFRMPFSVKTFPGEEAYRLEATTEKQEFFIPDTESFLFYNYSVTPEGCPHNGLTYYHTRMEDD